VSAVANVQIRIDAKQAKELLRKLEQQVKQLNGTFGDVPKQAGGAFGKLKGIFSSTVTQLGLVTGAAFSAKSAFDTLSNQSRSIAALRSLNVNAEEASAAFLKLSKDLKGQASQVELTAAAYDVASAGFGKVSDQVAILEASTKGAVGGMSDLNTVGNAVTSVLNAYGMSAMEAGRLVDQFIQTQNDGKIIVAQYASEIGKVASVAAGLGIDLAEVNAVIAQSTAAGVKSEVAFTGLKTALAQLASGQATERIKELGITIDAASLQSDGLVGTFRRIKDSGADVGQVLKLLGTEAGPALQPILNNLEKFEQLVNNQKNSLGASKKAFDDLRNTLGGAVKQLQTSITNLITSLAPLVPALVEPIKLFSAALNVVTDNIKGILKVGAFLLGFIGTLTAITLATRAWAAATKILATAQKAAAIAAAALQALSGPAGIAKVFAGLAVGAIAAKKIGDSIDDAFKSTEDLNKGTEDVGTKIEDVLQKYKNLTESSLKRLSTEEKISQVLSGQNSDLIGANAQEQLRLNAAEARLNNENTVANAMYGALLQVNNLEMQRAQNAGNTQKQYQLQLQKAELIYKQSVLQVQSEIRKAELGALQVKIELQKLKAATLQKAAKGEATQADYEALVLQKQAVELAFQGVDAARQAAMYHMQGANAIHQKTVEMAAFNRAQSTGRFSGGGGGAIGGGGGGGAIGGGGGVTVTSMGTTRSLGAATPQQLASQLSAKGIGGAFTEQQASATLSGLYAQRVQKYIDDRAAKGFKNISPTSVSEAQLERTGFAEGGFVTRPTDAMVGEGGQPEYVIPASKMNDAVRRYSAGTRGEAVVSGAMSSGGANSTSNYSNQQNAYYGGGTGASVNITTGPVIRMDNRDYVTMTDMQRGMAAAAGASQASMMRSMSRSYATRRSMGL
jgi:TP901 family phage tail tape measure protein